METDESLTALKKAYADVILKITEEAAARVIVSERKSIKYQHELKVAKEEGLRMLLRLKNMMDAQIREAAAASLSQQDKIEELEAQLEEAEEIVRVLREQLEEVQAELERVGKENRPEGFRTKGLPRENDVHSYQTEEYFPLAEYVVPIDLGVSRGNEGIPSIISKNKEPGLYRNGCTQRIRACEYNSKRDLCLLGETNKDKENGDETSKPPASVAKTVIKLEKKLLSDLGSTGSLSFIRKRKRSTRQKNSMFGSDGKQSYDLMKHEQSGDETALYVNTPSLGPSSCDENTEPQDQIIDAEAPEEKTNTEEASVVRTRQNGKGSKIKMSPEVYSLDSVPSEEAEQVFSSHLLNGKAVKFTYQRKRKKEVSGGGSLEIEHKSGYAQNDDKKLRQSKSSALKESAQEQRRLAQVARQLLSLSGKRWS